MDANTSANFATPDVRSSDLIAALRTIAGSGNSGFTRYANQANAAALSLPKQTTSLRAFNPEKLSMPEYVAPEVLPSGGDTTFPDPIGISPDPVLPTLPEVVISQPEPFDPGEPVEPDPVPEIVKPEPEPEPDPVDFWEPNPVDPEPSIRTDPIVSDIPDQVLPEDIPTITPTNPIELPDLPDAKDLVDASYWDEVDTPDVVGPTRGQPDLPEEFDQYLQPEAPPAPSVLEPEVVGDPDFYEPYFPAAFEPEPYVQQPSLPQPEDLSDEDVALIEAWLMDQFGGGGGSGLGGSGGDLSLEDIYSFLEA